MHFPFCSLYYLSFVKVDVKNKYELSLKIFTNRKMVDYIYYTYYILYLQVFKFKKTKYCSHKYTKFCCKISVTYNKIF